MLHPAIAYNYLDVGPTTDLSVNARPMTDDRINFEDLVMFGLNFGLVSSPAASAVPVAAARDELRLEAPSATDANGTLTATLVMRGTGVVHAISAALSWDASVVQPVGQEVGDWLAHHDGVLMSAAPGSVDMMVLGSDVPGMTGEGDLARVTFRVLRAGDPQLALARVDARSGANQRVNIASSAPRGAPSVAATQLGLATPTPFRERTRVAYSLATRGTVQLSILSVDGRLVRTLAAGEQEPGNYHIEWNGRDDQGHACPRASTTRD